MIKAIKKEKTHYESSFPQDIHERVDYITHTLSSIQDPKLQAKCAATLLTNDPQKIFLLYKDMRVRGDSLYANYLATLQYFARTSDALRAYGKTKKINNATLGVFTQQLLALLQIPNAIIDFKTCQQPILATLRLFIQETVVTNHALFANDRVMQEIRELELLLADYYSGTKKFDEYSNRLVNLILTMSGYHFQKLSKFIGTVTEDLYASINTPFFKERIDFHFQLIDFACEFFTGDRQADHLKRLKARLAELQGKYTDKEAAKQILKFINETILKESRSAEMGATQAPARKPNNKSKKKGEPEKGKEKEEPEIEKEELADTSVNNSKKVDAEKLVKEFNIKINSIFFAKKTNASNKASDLYSEITGNVSIPPTLMFEREPVRYLENLSIAYKACLEFDTEIERAELDVEEMENLKDRLQEYKRTIIAHYNECAITQPLNSHIMVAAKDWFEVTAFIRAFIEKNKNKAKTQTPAEILLAYLIKEGDEKESVLKDLQRYYGLPRNGGGPFALMEKNKDLFLTLLKGECNEAAVDAMFRDTITKSIEVHHQSYKKMQELSSELLCATLQDDALKQFLQNCLADLIAVNKNLSSIVIPTVEGEYSTLHAIRLDRNARILQTCIASLQAVLENYTDSQHGSNPLVRLAAMHCICFLGETHKKLPAALREAIAANRPQAKDMISDWRRTELIRNQLYHEATQMPAVHKKYLAFLTTGKFGAEKGEKLPPLVVRNKAHQSIMSNLQEAIKRVLFYEMLLLTHTPTSFKHSACLLALSHSRILSDVGDWIPKLSPDNSLLHGCLGIQPIQKCLEAFNAGHAFLVDVPALASVISSIPELLNYVKLSRNTVAHNFIFSHHSLMPTPTQGYLRDKLRGWRRDQQRRKSAEEDVPTSPIGESSPQPVLPIDFLRDKFVPIMQLSLAALILVDQASGDLYEDFEGLIQSNQETFTQHFGVDKSSQDFIGDVIKKITDLLQDFAARPVEKYLHGENEKEKEKSDKSIGPRAFGLFGLYSCSRALKEPDCETVPHAFLRGGV